MNRSQKSLGKLSRGKASKWGKDANYRLMNRKWLMYSSNIARRLLAGIEDTENMNQKILANKVGVSAQYINKVLKGSENLTLETIGKLSDAIGQELISFPPYKYSIPANQMVNNHLNTPVNYITMHLLGLVVMSKVDANLDSNIHYPINANPLNSLRGIIAELPDSAVTFKQ
jgi:transcriptional regulator with XRE-family HTH domain